MLMNKFTFDKQHFELNTKIQQLAGDNLEMECSF